ncbi:hypothetical protein [Streptomyces sp. HC307]|uniref:hypothetical protein n=1 Tax=Streptomyces flavusporus TaxID=3385496 RepID=UPI0039172CFC
MAVSPAYEAPFTVFATEVPQRAVTGGELDPASAAFTGAVSGRIEVMVRREQLRVVAKQATDLGEGLVCAGGQWCQVLCCGQKAHGFLGVGDGQGDDGMGILDSVPFGNRTYSVAHFSEPYVVMLVLEVSPRHVPG